MTIDNSFIKRKNLSNCEPKSESVLKLTEKTNCGETGKTPKRNNIIDIKKNKSFNHKNVDNIKKLKSSREKTDIIDIDNTSSYRILVKKRPKNEISKTSKRSKRRNSTSNIMFNNSRKTNNKSIYEICSCENININPRDNNNYNKDKLSFKNEDELINYVYKLYEEERKKKNYFNKKLRFTGFVLTKQYKGKNVYEIRIEDNIEKINNQLKNEKVTVNDEIIEIIHSEDKNKYINNLNELNKLYEENKRLKSENENLIEKGVGLNELIKKLEKEKFCLIDQINKLSNEIKELKNTNDKLIENNKNFPIQLNKNKLSQFQIESNSIFSIHKSINLNHGKGGANTKNISTLNYNENSLIINDKEKIKNDENYSNLISNENRYIIGHIIINDNFEDNNLIIQNQNHPKINDLVEEGMSDEELK